MTRLDHDQRFKLLVKEFIRDFFELFLPSYAPLFDFTRVEWLETEAFPDPPQGKRRVLDIVGRLPLVAPIQTGTDAWTTELVAIIHVEIESADSVQPLRTTMFQNFTCLRQKYSEPILPIAPLSERRSGRHRCGSLRRAVWSARCAAIQLPVHRTARARCRGILGAGELAGRGADRANEGPSGIAGAIQGRGAQPTGEITGQRISEASAGRLRQSVPVLEPFREEAEFERLLKTNEYREVRAMELTWYEEGLEEGLDLGGRRLATILLERRFGAIPPEIQQRIEQWPESRLVELVEQSFQVGSLEELRLDESSAGRSSRAPTNVTADELLRFASRFEDEQWATLYQHRPFRYRVTAEGIEFIPESKKGRPVLLAEVAAFCDEFNLSGSFRPGDYPDNWHKSYLLALIRRFAQEHALDTKGEA